jgi:dihydroflavonol-4-reductase
MTPPPTDPMRRALVLGASGFIGINVADALRSAGHHVAGSYRGRAPAFFLRGRVDETVAADLADPLALRAAMRGRDVVFHAAGHYPRYSLDREGAIETALRQTRNVFDAALAEGVSRVVYTSSIGALHRGDGHAASEDDLAPGAPSDSVYRAVKWHLEHAALDARRRGLDVVVLRPGGCLGPWDMHAGTGGVVVAVVRGLLSWWVDGHVHMVDVRDVARAHVAALGAPTQRSYNLAGHGVRVEVLFRSIGARYGGALPGLALSPDEARARADAEERAAAPARGRVVIPRELVDVALSGAPVSDALAHRELGFDPRPLDESLDASVAWFRRTGHLPAATPPAAPDPTQCLP